MAIYIFKRYYSLFFKSLTFVKKNCLRIIKESLIIKFLVLFENFLFQIKFKLLINAIFGEKIYSIVEYGFMFRSLINAIF
jgi:hypothetical protein